VDQICISLGIIFAKKKLEAIEGPFELAKLHIAAYIGHFDEVVILVGQDLNAVAETNYEGETAREMLQNTLPNAVQAKWASRFCEMAERVIEFLENKELELEEERYFAQIRWAIRGLRTHRFFRFGTSKLLTFYKLLIVGVNLASKGALPFSRRKRVVQRKRVVHFQASRLHTFLSKTALKFKKSIYN
jgi:hypothetical protein